MKFLINLIKTNWKDPVWSKVISAFIIFVVGLVSTAIYAGVKSLYAKLPFADMLHLVSNFLIRPVVLSMWIFILSALIFLAIFLKQLIDIFARVYSSLFKKTPEEVPIELSVNTQHSTALFSYRMAQAFPGIRELAWFENPKIAVRRLSILLEEPLRFRSSQDGYAEGDPIWWFRGGSALFIENFRILGRTKILMNHEQMIIKKIAAYQGNQYFRNFVYVEVLAEAQTGLYPTDSDTLKLHVEKFGYSWEEYGILKLSPFRKKLIKREEYDDGGTVTRDRVIDATNAELRTRYVTDYNFIIAAKGSPYNSSKFDSESKPYLDGILTGKISYQAFFDFLLSFRKNEGLI